MITFRRTRRLLRNYGLDWYYWAKSRREFRDGLRDLRSVDDAIKFLWSFEGGGFYGKLKPNQDRQELKALAERMAALKPKVAVEIGTRMGGTLFMWSQAAATLEHLVSIDLPAGIHGGGYPAPRSKLYREFVFNRPKCQLHLLRVDSQLASTRARVEQLLGGRPIDFLFIDGDHRYTGVKADYELYGPLVRSGGIVAFHDIRPNPEVESVEVYRLWDDLKTKHKAEELVTEPYRGHFGIGVLYKE